jgi:murein DD-endopeptidase MepM/ murein hydrolase activator NlpD
MRAAVLAILLAALAAAPASAVEATEDGRPPAPPAEAAFPVLGPVSYGEFGASFGGGRGHMGHDVLAECGTPVVAARAGTVVENKYEGAAGHYVVVETLTGRSNVYMHLAQPSKRAIGRLVLAGDRLGRVGSTGVASACHLHFELWTAPGWYAGGEAVDPLPLLLRLADLPD